jgi:hypothetical protein
MKNSAVHLQAFARASSVAAESGSACRPVDFLIGAVELGRPVAHPVIAKMGSRASRVRDMGAGQLRNWHGTDLADLTIICHGPKRR